MISDYALSVLDECDKDTLHRICQELLQLREEKRKAYEARAKSWEGAPEWAQWRARDREWYGFYFEERPTPLLDDWRVIGRIADWPQTPWEDTLEPRP